MIFHLLMHTGKYEKLRFRNICRGSARLGRRVPWATLLAGDCRAKSDESITLFCPPPPVTLHPPLATLATLSPHLAKLIWPLDGERGREGR